MTDIYAILAAFAESGVESCTGEWRVGQKAEEAGVEQNDPAQDGMATFLGCLGGAAGLGVLAIAAIVTGARTELWLESKGLKDSAGPLAFGAAALVVALLLGLYAGAKLLYARVRRLRVGYDAFVVDQLLEIYRAHPEGFVMTAGGHDVKKLRRIGDRLNKRAGMEGMLKVHEAFAVRCTVPGAARNLEHMWDGIGEWLG